MHPGDVIAERYEIEQRAAEGGMGTIYRAFDHARRIPVAVKLLRHGEATDLGRFAREARLLALVSHPAIVGFVDHGVADGAPFLVMEWLAGETLSDRLGGAGVTAAEAVAVVRRVAGALGELHRLGIVHRDVKPENIVFPAGVLADAKLIDFGLARRETATLTLTRTGTMVGTPAYMAPEQARGEPVDARADVFALGCVLHECLTGAPPFTGDSRVAIWAKLVFCDPPRLAARCPELPPALVGTVERMMARAAADRFTDGAALARALADPALPGPAQRRRSRRDPVATPATQPALAFACVVLVEAGAPGVPDAPPAARIERLAGGEIAVVVDRGAPREQAALAVRMAREMARAFPGAVAVTGGPGPLDAIVGRAAALLADAAIDRAVGRTAGASATLIALDPALAALVDLGAVRADDGTT